MSDERTYGFVHDWRLDGVRWSTPDDCVVTFTGRFWENDDDDPPTSSAVLALHGVSDATMPLGAAESESVYTVRTSKHGAGQRVCIDFAGSAEPFELRCERYEWLSRPDGSP